MKVPSNVKSGFNLPDTFDYTFISNWEECMLYNLSAEKALKQ